MAALPFDVLFFDMGDTLVSSTREWLPGAKELLPKLKADGYRIGVISNTATLTRAQLKAILPPDFDFGLFSGELVLLSSETGIEKPKLEAFSSAVQKAKVPASRCLFCTESALDTLAAQKAGMAAIRLLPPPHSDIGTLRDRLNKLKCLLP
jgi:FMN phosphatase YigB (HAD superfamily)